MKDSLIKRIKKFAKKAALTGGLLLGSAIPAYASDMPRGFDITQEESHSTYLKRELKRASLKAFLSPAYSPGGIVSPPDFAGIGGLAKLNSPETGDGSAYLRCNVTLPFAGNRYDEKKTSKTESLGVGLDFRAGLDGGSALNSSGEKYTGMNIDQWLGALFYVKDFGIRFTLSGGEFWGQAEYNYPYMGNMDQKNSGNVGGYAAGGIDIGKYAGYVDILPINWRFCAGVYRQTRNVEFSNDLGFHLEGKEDWLKFISGMYFDFDLSKTDPVVNIGYSMTVKYLTTELYDGIDQSRVAWSVLNKAHVSFSWDQKITNKLELPFVFTISPEVVYSDLEDRGVLSNSDKKLWYVGGDVRLGVSLGNPVLELIVGGSRCIEENKFNLGVQFQIMFGFF